MSKSIARLLEVTCCSPRGADLLSGWFAVTVLLGALVLAGNQLFAVSVDLGLMDFLEGGEITETVMGCNGEEIESDNRTNRTLAVLSCWDDSQKDLVFWLVTLLDSAWALVYAPFLALLFLRLFFGLAADRLAARVRLRNGDRPVVLPGQSWPLRVTLLLVLGLLLADLTENILAWVVTLGPERQNPDVWVLAVGWVSFVKPGWSASCSRSPGSSWHSGSSAVSSRASARPGPRPRRKSRRRILRNQKVLLLRHRTRIVRSCAAPWGASFGVVGMSSPCSGSSAS